LDEGFEERVARAWLVEHLTEHSVPAVQLFNHKADDSRHQKWTDDL